MRENQRIMERFGLERPFRTIPFPPPATTRDNSHHPGFLQTFLQPFPGLLQGQGDAKPRIFSSFALRAEFQELILAPTAGLPRKRPGRSGECPNSSLESAPEEPQSGFELGPRDSQSWGVKTEPIPEGTARQDPGGNGNCAAGRKFWNFPASCC